MLLTLDVGNSQIYGGVFEKDKLMLQFRKNSRHGTSSDEIGVFLRTVLRENFLDPEKVERIAMCSVVPDLVHSIRGACQKYFKQAPFILQAGVKTGLRVRYHNPLEVGADRIANAVGASSLFSGKNLIIIDMGTATTFCAVTAEKDYLGGLILPGLRLQMEVLESGTAKLPTVEILRPTALVGRTTVESIQAGLYHGSLAVIKYVSDKIRHQIFENSPTLLIGTGGFSRLFEKENIFDHFIPELVLIGLKRALDLNIEPVKE